MLEGSTDTIYPPSHLSSTVLFCFVLFQWGRKDVAGDREILGWSEELTVVEMSSKGAQCPLPSLNAVLRHFHGTRVRSRNRGRLCTVETTRRAAHGTAPGLYSAESGDQPHGAKQYHRPLWPCVRECPALPCPAPPCAGETFSSHESWEVLENRRVRVAPPLTQIQVYISASLVFPGAEVLVWKVHHAIFGTGSCSQLFIA